MAKKLWRFFGHIQPPGNRVLQAGLRGTEPAGTQTVSGSCNSQLALFITERHRELRPAVAFSKNSWKHRSVEISGNFL